MNKKTKVKTKVKTNVNKKVCNNCNKYLGKGRHGRVYTSKKNKNIVIKIIKKKDYNNDEFKFAKKAGDLGIGPKIYKKSTNKDYVLIYMELITIPLYKWLLKKHTKKEYDDAYTKLVKLVKKLHKNNIIHGDIHVGNIGLIKNKWVLYDYGKSHLILDSFKDTFVQVFRKKFRKLPSYFDNSGYETYFKHILKPYDKLTTDVTLYIKLLSM